MLLTVECDTFSSPYRSPVRLLQIFVKLCEILVSGIFLIITSGEFYKAVVVQWLPEVNNDGDQRVQNHSHA